MGLARGPCCCRVLVEVVARVEKDAVLKEAAIRTDIRVTKRFSRSARTPVHSPLTPLEYIDPNVVHSIFNIQPSYPPETENIADMMHIACERVQLSTDPNVKEHPGGIVRAGGEG